MRADAPQVIQSVGVFATCTLQCVCKCWQAVKRSLVVNAFGDPSVQASQSSSVILRSLLSGVLFPDGQDCMVKRSKNPVTTMGWLKPLSKVTRYFCSRNRCSTKNESSKQYEKSNGSGCASKSRRDLCGSNDRVRRPGKKKRKIPLGKNCRIC